ncbi:MAG TPA: amidohydrolase family protein [Myxococcota bacterium]|nr:amidohydrolase family protein [Myxococcota bacterium]
MHDRVLRGGLVIDGTGAPGREADVAIDGGRIAAVGEVRGRGREEVDCRGLLVCPGFVDMHTHYDGQATWDPWLTPSGWHGVTTAVVGNCGVGFAPCREEDREWLIGVMEGVEDIPGTALHEGIRWSWRSFPEYLDALERSPLALDVGAFVPHASVRGYVMGRRASEQAQADEAEIDAMRQIVAEALRAGALGFSTSRTSLHRTAEGVLVAGTDAAVPELEGICEALAEVGHGVFEIADEHGHVPADLDWLAGIARRTGRPVVFNLSQIDAAPELWREGLAGVERAAAAGIPLFAQAAGRAIGVHQSWRATAHPFALCNTWAGISHLGWDEQLRHLRDPAFRERMIADEPFFIGEFQQFITRTFDRMFPVEAGFEPDPAESVGARARRLGLSPAAVAYDALTADDGAGMLYFPLFNYARGDLDLLHALHSHPRVLMGLSDGGAHCGAICDGGMPTFMLTHWARDRTRGPRLPLEHVIHRQTQATAAFVGLRDRGVLAPGMRADVNVIDFDRLGFGRVHMAWDLPAGGRRLVQRATGYRLTLVAGVPTRVDDEATGATPGRLVRGPQAA